MATLGTVLGVAGAGTRGAGAAAVVHRGSADRRRFTDSITNKSFELKRFLDEPPPVRTRLGL